MSKSTLASVMATAVEGVSKSDAPDVPKNSEGEKATLETVGKVNASDTAQTVADAIAAERVRMCKIDAMALPGCESIISEAKASGASVGDTAVHMIQHIQKAGLMDAAAALRASAETVPALDAMPHDPMGNAGGVVPQTAEGWGQEYRASSDLQKEFGSEAAYVAFNKNTAAGRVRILKK